MIKQRGMMTIRWRVSFAGSILAVVLLAGVSLALAADELKELHQEIESLKVGQETIKKDLKAIKDLLTSLTRPRSKIQDVNLSVNVAKYPAKGPADAEVTLIEFTDYQCPFCARNAKSVLPKLTKDFVETGKIRYVLRDFPLTAIHKDAAKAHEAAHCAGEQGKYWEMHAQLFAHQKELQAEKLAGHAAAAGVTDKRAFQTCVDSGKYAKKIQASMAEGSKASVRGTPSFLLGRTEADGTVKATKLIRGAHSYPVFQQHIYALLASSKSEMEAQPKSESK